MFPHRVSVSYSHRLKADGVQRLHHVFFFLSSQSPPVALPIGDVCRSCLYTDLFLIFQKWPPRFSHSQSTIFAFFLDLASLIFSRGLVCAVQSASLIGHLWVLHLSGTVGLGRQTRNTICRQSHRKPILPVQFLPFADSRMVVFQASNMEYHRAFQKESLRTGAAGCFPSFFFLFPLGGHVPESWL